MAWIEARGGLTLQERGPNGVSIFPYPNNRTFTPSAGYDGMSKFTLPSYTPPIYDYLFTKKNVETIFSDGTFKNGYDFGMYLYYRSSTNNSVAIENGLIHIHQKYNSSEYVGFCLNKKTLITSSSRLIILASSKDGSGTGSEVVNNHTNWVGLASLCGTSKSWHGMNTFDSTFTPIKTAQADVSTMSMEYQTNATGYYNYDNMAMRVFDIPLQSYQAQLAPSSTDTSLYIYIGGHAYSQQGDYYIKYIGVIGDNQGSAGTPITPSDSSPVALTSGNTYQPTSNGYAISSQPTALTPSDTGTYFTTGMKRITGSTGYAYNGKPILKPTVLWTNPSTSTSSSTEFAGGTPITLTQSVDNFDYIGVYWEQAYGITTNKGTVIWSKDDFKKFRGSATTSGVTDGFFGMYVKGSSVSYWYLRNIYYTDTTTVTFSNTWRMSISTSATNTKSNTRVIPKYIYGYKVQA
jgi:hypothetical protein